MMMMMLPACFLACIHNRSQYKVHCKYAIWFACSTLVLRGRKQADGLVDPDKQVQSVFVPVC